MARLVKYGRVMKHSSTRQTLTSLLLAAATSACGAEAPIDADLGETDRALTKQAGLFSDQTGGYVSTLKIARNASAGCSAQSVVLSGGGKTVNAKTCVGKLCTSAPLSSLTFVDDNGVVPASALTLGTTDDVPGDIEPIEVDDLMYVCSENEKEGVCECIPWFPPE
jgi:hypothetical protein